MSYAENEPQEPSKPTKKRSWADLLKEQLTNTISAAKEANTEDDKSADEGAQDWRPQPDMGADSYLYGTGPQDEDLPVGNSGGLWQNGVQSSAIRPQELMQYRTGLTQGEGLRANLSWKKLLSSSYPPRGNR